MPVLDSAAERSNGHDTADPFAFWAEVYDEQPNPLLSLEEDFVPRLLPQLRGLDVIDLGCGTGRWLQRLARQQPRSLLGIDSSREMIARAAAKVGRDAVLLRADCGSVALSAGSADLCLASFVLSHVGDLHEFARQLSHALRPDGNAFITDVHPETAARFGWKRAFRYGDESISLRTHERPIAEIIFTLRECGLEATLFLEPCFQSPQRRTLLEMHGSQLDGSTFQSPAIYILQVKRCATAQRKRAALDSRSVRLTGARISFGPHASTTAHLALGRGSVTSIGSRALEQSSEADVKSVDLSGYLLLPGLINSHDHLEFGLFPNLGRGGYSNAVEWAEDIQEREAAVIAKHRSIPKAVRCWWGAIRNLLCGVTMVCHHNPLIAELSRPDFPVRVLRDYEWAHSLGFDFDVAPRQDSDPETPFIIHAGEGIDERSAAEIAELDRRGLLNARTVLVHALALDSDTVSLLNQRGAAVVWCPTSNRFLFGNTLDADTLSGIHNLALGSDSALTSAGDLLEDVNFAYRETGISPERLYEMVYTAPSRIFRMRNGEGRLRPGGVADLIAIRDADAEPAEVLANLSGDDVELIVLRGQIQLARKPIMERLPPVWREGLVPVDLDGKTVWLRAPIAKQFHDAVGSLQVPIYLGRKRVRYVANC